MADGINKVIIVGYLGKDPEVRDTQGGQTVANFSVAVSESWKDRDGERQERTEWFRVVVWGAQAESCGQHLSKGSQVYVEGKLQTRKWTDRDGQERYATEVNAQRVLFLSRADGGGGGSERSSGGGSRDVDDGDIPF